MTTSQPANRPDPQDSATPGVAPRAGSDGKPEGTAEAVRVESLSAVTLATSDMARAFRFYDALGFDLNYGGADAAFTSFGLGQSYLNLIAESRGPIRWWGRVIVYVSDVDAMYRRALAAGLTPQMPPSDAPWGERYFHLTDPDGHELSFARPLRA